MKYTVDIPNVEVENFLLEFHKRTLIAEVFLIRQMRIDKYQRNVILSPFEVLHHFSTNLVQTPIMLNELVKEATRKLYQLKEYNFKNVYGHLIDTDGNVVHTSFDDIKEITAAIQNYKEKNNATT